MGGEIKLPFSAYIDSISTKYSVKHAILFGSFAKGTNNDDSDIDIAINNVVDIIDTQIDLRIEPHPFMIGDFDQSNPVVNEILKHGIIIKNKVA